MDIHVTNMGVTLTHTMADKKTHEVSLDFGWPLTRKFPKIGYNLLRSGDLEHSRTEVVRTPSKIKGDLTQLSDLANHTRIMLEEVTHHIRELDIDEGTKKKILSALKKARSEFD